jgi:hypothetical protein
MAFLDNSGDIILDAVLTDTGRFRLAKGDGSFKIAKFALGDDEIDYTQYDKNNASGSAYYDLTIMQTPVLEAFTNNASSMISKLVTMSRNNLMYLPIIKLNEESPNNQTTGIVAGFGSNFFYVAVDQNTENEVANGTWTSGVISGQTLTQPVCVLLEQGLDTMEIPPNVALDVDLVEDQYILEMDNRFGKPAKKDGKISIASPSFIDDDNIASYYFSLAQTPGYVTNEWPTKVQGTETQNINAARIRGPRGTQFYFRIASSIDLATSTYLFEKLGGTTSLDFGGGGGAQTYYFIDSNVRVIGGTTGFTLDIPFRYIKLQPS